MWAATDTFDTPGGLIRIRSSSPAAGAAVRAVLAPWLVPDVVDGGFLYSVRLEPASARGATQPLHALYENCNLVRRSRDPLRIVRLLAAHVVGRWERGSRTRIAVAGAATAGVRGAAAFPVALEADLARAERRLNRAGLQLVDSPFLVLDSLTGELVVPAPPDVDPAVLDGVALFRADEPGPAPEGRHRLGGWMLDGLRSADDVRRPAMKLVLSGDDTISRERVRRAIGKAQDRALLVDRWHPWPADIAPAVVRLAEGRL